MALSVVDLYQKILPRTNCKDCGYPTCLAFASMVVSEKFPLGTCPHIPQEILDAAVTELEDQYRQGKWLKRDLAQDALDWARERAASLEIGTLPDRIGGKIVETRDGQALELPYFNDYIVITPEKIAKRSGNETTRWEQVFIYNHLAQGGSAIPSGSMKSFKEFPNTVSKVKSMTGHVEIPLQEYFKGKTEALSAACLSLGGKNVGEHYSSPDLAFNFIPLPKVPVTLLFWDEIPQDNYEAQVKLLFDETVTEHLDLESIIFLSERLKDLLCESQTEP